MRNIKKLLIAGMAGLLGFIGIELWIGCPWPTEEDGNLLPRDYELAQRAFRLAALSAGANLYTLALDASGPGGEPLSIDIAWLGSPTPRRALLHVSGVHGVEGFAGSAIQKAILENPLSFGDEDALILVHALNPYGMAWLRRFNESNVDLNRNLSDDARGWNGAPLGYHQLDKFLNPPTSPGFDFFCLRALFRAAMHGFVKLKGVIAAGQYEYPKGLFYGGKGLEQGPRLYRAWLEKSFQKTQYIAVIDVHTGLGSWRQNSLFHKIRATGITSLPAEIRSHLVADYENSDVVGYRLKGPHASVFRQLFPGKPVDFFTQEFGTYSNLKVLHALREENRHHHYNGGTLDHPTKRRLKEVFSPASGEWQKSVMGDGLRLIENVLQVLSAK